MTGGGSLQTPLDKPYGQTPEAHAAAVARVSREPDSALLLAMLGLTVEQPAQRAYMAIDGRLHCAVCKGRTQGDGICRRKTCGGER